jgi:hypothetical protein
MPITRARFVVAAALCFVYANASAVNVLSNPGFNTDTSGWAQEDPANSTLAWSALDANAAAGSGSALVTNTSAGPSNGTGIIQCVPTIVAGGNYTFGGKVLYPTGQATTGDMQIGLRWHAGPNCTGAVLGSQPRVSVNTPAAAWATLTSAVEVPPVGTVSADFIAFPSKVQAGGQLAGNFDDLFLDNGIAAPPPSSPGAAIPLAHPAILVLIALGLVAVARRYIARR